MNDPIVNEVRKIRDAHSEKFGYDISKIVLDYQKKHDGYKKRLEGLRKMSSAA
jgi:hypothetical protein